MIGVYKIVINNKTYVGSSFNIKTRIRQHKSDLKRGRHDNPYLQKAFVKYQEFNWEVVEEVVCNITDKELRKLEKQWMEKLHPEYNMQDPETNFIIKKVYQFSKNGEFIKEYESTAEAALELGISQSNIVHAAQENETLTKTAGGFIWRYTKEFGEYIDKRHKDIYMYDMWGRYIKTFKTFEECRLEIAPNVRKDTFMSNINNVCINKIASAYGYRFSKEKVEQLDNTKLLQFFKNFPILQLSFEGDKILKIWNKASDAAKFFNIKSCEITQAIAKNTTCKGYRWTRLGTKLSELLEKPEDIETKAEDENLNVNV